MRPSIEQDGVRYYLARRLDDMDPNTGARVQIGDKDIALFLVNDRAIAVDNACPHQGTSLCDGAVQNDRLVCPAHAWNFDINTGRGPTDESYAIATYPTLIQQEAIWVSITPKSHE